MDRRSFIKGIITAAIAPSVLISTFSNSFKWKKLLVTGIWVPNPEWINASYEIKVLAVSHGYYDFILTEREKELKNCIYDPFPIRYKEENGVLVQVHPIIRKDFEPWTI